VRNPAYSVIPDLIRNPVFFILDIPSARHYCPTSLYRRSPE
jgi:hypothetical protein